MSNRGPIEDGHWDDALEGWVVDPGPPPRLHGYDVWHDLAQHYGLAEIVLTTLVGEAPDAAHGRAFELALVLAAPASVGEAATHAAAIARMLAAPPASLVAMAAVVLGEQAQAVVEGHTEWLAWLDHGGGEPPASALATSDADLQCIAVVRTLVEPTVCPALARIDPSIHAIIVALLHACGLRTPAVMVAALVTARLPAVVAEADRHRRDQLHSYPMQLPPFDYEETP